MAETTLRETLGLIGRVIWESGLSDRVSIWELVLRTAQDQLSAMKEAAPPLEDPDHEEDEEEGIAAVAVLASDVQCCQGPSSAREDKQRDDRGTAEVVNTEQSNNSPREHVGKNLADLERVPDDLDSTPHPHVEERASGIVFSGLDSQLKSDAGATVHDQLKNADSPTKGGVIQFATGGGHESFVLYSLMKRYFLMTCNDLFNAAECHKRAPWSMGPYINECRDKALRRCYNIRKMIDDLNCPMTTKARCDDSSSTAAEESDYSDSALIFPPDSMRMGPRTPVRAEDVDFAPLPSYSKTPEEIAVITATLDAGTSFVFEAIRDQEERKKKLVDALKPVAIPAGSFAIRSGDTGDGMYFIGVGKFSVLRGDQEIKQLGPGDIFGELAVLHQSTRTYSCKALEDSTVYFLHRSSYIALIRSNR